MLSGIGGIDQDGTPVDSEVICSRAYVAMFQRIWQGLRSILKQVQTLMACCTRLSTSLRKVNGSGSGESGSGTVYAPRRSRPSTPRLKLSPVNALLDAMTVPIPRSLNGLVASKNEHFARQAGRCCTTSRKNCSVVTISSAGKPDPGADVPRGEGDERQRGELHSGG